MAAADAEGGKTLLGLVALEHLVEQGDDDAGAGAADGVTQGDGAAVDVDLAHVEVQLTGDGDGLGGKGLVGLDEVDVRRWSRRPWPWPDGRRATGPTPMILGSTPPWPQPMSFAMGLRPYFLTASPEARTMAAAPSLMPEALPAVTRWTCLRVSASWTSVGWKVWTIWSSTPSGPTGNAPLQLGKALGAWSRRGGTHPS